MKNLTKQQIFNKIWKRSETGVKALNNGVCSYRTSDGQKCFAGVLIKNKYYKKELEGNNASSDMVKPVLKKSGIPTDGETLTFINKLQIVHDAYSPRNWELELREIAQRYGLKVPA